MSFFKKIRSNLPNSEVGDLVCVGEDSYLIDVDSYKISFCSSDIREDGFKKFSNLYMSVHQCYMNSNLLILFHV